MRITHGRVSNSIKAFKDAYLKKFKLINGFDFFRPVVFFGMYEDQDYKAFLQYTKTIIVVWCGTDTLMINPQRLKILQSRNAIHIVKSKFQSADLNKLGISHEIIPISWQSFELDPVPLGKKIYHYGKGERYGEQYLPEIEKRTGIEIVKTTVNTYPREKLLEVYKDCFMGLRLTTHDGLPNTVIELGMMGRRCIYNGRLPNSIGWFDVKDICANIENENRNRDCWDIKKISAETKKFIDIGDSWLNI
jgi:hypothetical protein